MRVWQDHLKAAARNVSVSFGIVLIFASSAAASGDQIIPYFLGAAAFTFAFTYVVYRVAASYSRRSGVAALAYFGSTLAIWYLCVSGRATNVFDFVETQFLRLLPELDPMSFSSNFIGVSLMAMEVVIPASCVAVITVLLTERKP